jgi:YfiH family protein
MRHTGLHIEPDWAAPAGVKALFTTRAGGVSVAPFDSLNLGDHVRDDPRAVATNRQRLSQWVGPCRPVFLQQVHGTRVAHLRADTADGLEADGCVVQAGAGVAATIMVADCLPLLFCLPSGKAVAAAHAGWRGLAAGVIETTVQSLKDVADSPEDSAGLMAWLGPCIGPAAFEVGPEVLAAMEAHDAGAGECFTAASGHKYLANLPALARRRLQAMGLGSVSGNDGTSAWCTVTQTSTFFSHRRDAARLGGTGRMAACIWID